MDAGGLPTRLHGAFSAVAERLVFKLIMACDV